MWRNAGPGRSRKPWEEVLCSAGTRGLRAINGTFPSLGLPHSPAKVLTQPLGEDQVKRGVGEKSGQEEPSTRVSLVELSVTAQVSASEDDKWRLLS